MTTDLCLQPATVLKALLATRQISAVELTKAHLSQLERLNGRLNAIVTTVPDRALKQADLADAALARGDSLGPLHGLPVVHKDLAETAGIRTTYGSPIYADHVPAFDALHVARMRAAGAVTLGKSNAPEFGAGSQTFNAVFGATLNPYDLSRTCGGSSGGSAVALAAGLAALADGSDMGGSLRNPAGYCNVVGLRPSPGRVPSWPSSTPWSPLSVDGPMARTVADVALLLSAIAGPDPRAPLSLQEPGSAFGGALETDLRGLRVAWSPTLGRLPFDPQVPAALGPNRQVFVDLGCAVSDANLDLAGADEVFKTWRAWHFAVGLGPLLEQHRAQLKPTVIWNIEAGLALTGADLARAERLRAALLERVAAFFDQFDALVCPVSQVPPFPVTQEYVTQIGGQSLGTYIDWMASCYLISAAGLPAISVPGGFTAEGLPVGLQIVGRPRGDWPLLQLAHGFEQATGHGLRRPAVLS